MHTIVTCDVDYELMKRVYFALETARDNALQVFNEHIVNLKDYEQTSLDKHLTELLRSDITEIECLIKTLSDKWSFGR